jgi:hypothetical protein
VDLVLPGVGHNIIETVHHDFFEPCVDKVFIPEEALTVLHPLEIGNGNAAGIGENIGDDEDAFVGENGVGDGRGRAVRAFAQDAAAYSVTGMRFAM